MMYSYKKTILGIIKISLDSKIKKIEFVEKIENYNSQNNLSDLAFRQIEQYLQGNLSKFSFLDKLDLEGTDFQKKVWKALLEIPYSKTITYKEIAEKIGNPKAIRAVATAIGKNPIAIIIPCHRVIRSDGKLGGYAYGIDIKKKLLNIERKGAPAL